MIVFEASSLGLNEGSCVDVVPRLTCGWDEVDEVEGISNWGELNIESTENVEGKDIGI